jgi:hypothetical protein
MPFFDDDDMMGDREVTHIESSDPRSGWLMAAVGGIFLIVSLLGLLVMSLIDWPPWFGLLLKTGGEKHAAVVVRIDIDESVLVNDEPARRIHFSYEPKPGSKIPGVCTSFDPEVEELLPPGTKTEALVHPDYPKRGSLPGCDAATIGVFILIPLAFTVLALVLILLGIRHAIKKRKGD